MWCVTILFKDQNLSDGQCLHFQIYEQVYSHMFITIIAEIPLPNMDILNTEVLWENKQLSVSQWRTLSHIVVSSTPFHGLKSI